MLTHSYHDERILSIELIGGGLLVKITSKNVFVHIFISCLEKLRVVNFQEGNIINSMFIYSGKGSFSHEKSILASLRFLYDINPRSLEVKPSLSSFIDQQFKKILDGKLTLVEVEPSYGCYIIALGEEAIEQIIDED